MLEPAPNNRIADLLANLKWRIRRYVVVEGVALVVCLVCLLFWLSFWLDLAYFAIRRLELPQWFRAGTLMFGLGLLGLAVLLLLVVRLARGFHSKALALVLEKRFPELDDRLVTAVEMGRTPPEHSTALTEAMLERTVDGVTDESGRLPLGDVFQKRPIWVATISAIVLGAFTGVFWGLNSAAASRWVDAYLGLEDVYWTRDSELRIVVVAQPGDVVKEFRDADGQSTNGLPGTYKHPRGSELTILVYVPRERENGEAIVPPAPDDIRVTYRQAGRGGGDGGVFPVDDEALRDRLDAQAVYRFSRTDVTGTTKLWVTGNDYTNREPYLVEIVEPPQLDAIALACDFPAYTRTDLDVVQRVTGRTHEIPEETRFLFDATANKEIVGARIEFEQTEILLGPAIDEQGNAGPFEGRVAVRSEDGTHREETKLPDEIATRFLRADGLGLQVPFVVTRGITDAARERSAENFVFEEVDFGRPFTIAPGTKVRVYLSDIDGIETVDPTRITIDGREDRPPEFVDLGLKAIGNRITRKARIPFEGTITDDFGLATARFEFRVVRPDPMAPPAEEGEPDAEPARWRVRPFTTPPEDFPIEFHLEEDAETPFERFDVLPLDLKVGNTLIVTIRATDADDLNGPHESRTAEYAFEIVSESDLQALLYGREMDLLEQLQQVIAEVDRTRMELDGDDELGFPGVHEESSAFDAELAGDGDVAQLAALRTKLEGPVGIGLDRTRTSAGECGNIQQSFEEILEELSNNGVDERQISRMQQEVIAPLTTANTVHFPDLDRSLGGFKIGLEDSLPVRNDHLDSIGHAEALLAELRRVEKELEDRVNYLRAVRNLKVILEEEQELQRKTKDAQARELIEGLD